MLNEQALDAACDEWKRANDLLFTRRDKVRLVVETYLEHANKHPDHIADTSKMVLSQNSANMFEVRDNGKVVYANSTLQSMHEAMEPRTQYPETCACDKPCFIPDGKRCYNCSGLKVSPSQNPDGREDCPWKCKKDAEWCLCRTKTRGENE